MNSNTNTSADLRQFDSDFDQTPVEERNSTSVPDGKYQVNVEKVEMTRAQTSGNHMLKWGLRILGPTQQGRFIWRNSVITVNSLKFLKTDLYVCGLELKKISELPEHLGHLLDVKLEVTKKTTGENERVYFNRRIVTDSGFPPVKGLTGNDDVPF